MTDNYLKNYLILGIKPGASWKQLRQAYKKLVNVWHPDRFQQNIRQKRLAEEKTKEITQAYKELAEYHKKFGVLPLPPEEIAWPAGENNAGSAAPTKNPPPDIIKTPEPASVTPATEIPKRRISKQRTRVLAVMALLGSIYFIWQFVPGERQDYLSPSEEYTHQPLDDRHGRANADAAPDERHFTIGSSLGEVYTIQGVPTRTENDTWYYGNSKVYFVKGKVIGWEESIDNPLQIDLVPGSGKTNNHLFGQGSTKEEVMAAQGQPDRDAGNVWDYGASRVYFEGDRVTGWQEAPLYPLRIRE